MLNLKQAMVVALACIFLFSTMAWWFWYETPRQEMRRRIVAGVRYVNTLWTGYAFYETLGNRVGDYQVVYKDTNYVATRILNMPSHL